MIWNSSLSSFSLLVRPVVQILCPWLPFFFSSWFWKGWIVSWVFWETWSMLSS